MAKAKLTVARITSPAIDRPGKGLGDALVPGLPVERFNRTWRLEVSRSVLASLRGAPSKTPSPAPTMIRGRLGFDKTTGEAPAWDETAEAFVVRTQHDGDVVPFVIRLSDLTVAFQRTSKIHRQSFIGAMQKLLREGGQNDKWKVDDRLTRRAWEEFVTEVTVVTEVRIVVRPTNPGWAGQDLYQPFIDELGGDLATIIVKGDSLDLDSRPLIQAREHAIAHDYGDLTVKGANADGTEVRFDSDDAVPILDTSSDRPPGGEVSHEVLEHALEQADEIASDRQKAAPVEGPEPDGQ